MGKTLSTSSTVLTSHVQWGLTFHVKFDILIIYIKQPCFVKSLYAENVKKFGIS